MNNLFYPLAGLAWLLDGLSSHGQAQCSLTLPCPVSPDTVCDLTPNDPQLWNEAYWLDPVHNLYNLPEAPADLSIIATDTCAGAVLSLRYLLFLDLDGNGVTETVVDSDNLPPANTVYFNNVANPGYSGGQPQAFDERGLPPAQQWRFALQTTTSGDSTTASVRWNTVQSPGTYYVPELPYGQHKIRWIATNGLGDTTVCERNFTTRDCKPPVLVCNNGLSVNLMPTLQITLWASDFLQYAEDNVTPGNQIVLAVRKAGQGSGFPLNTSGQPVTSVSYTCDELGTQTIELWARDKAGNAGFCSTYVIVQDPFNLCGYLGPSVYVCAKDHCFQEGIAGVSFDLNGSHPMLPPLLMYSVSDSTGCVYFSNSIPITADYTITPEKDDNPMNGVSTFDLVLMSKHILGIEPLNTPYKIIAADVNKSNSVTTFDVVELRKLILGTYAEFPNNTSWRFVDQNFQFADPANPFASVPFPENISAINIQGSQLDNDFTGIKIGDLNCSAIASVSAPAQDRSPAWLTVPDRWLAEGETIGVPVSAAEAHAWLGFQLALRADPDVLVIEQVQPGALAGLDEAAFARPAPGLLTASWFDARPKWVAPDVPLFTLRLRALQPVRLREALTMETDRLAPEAYSAGEQRQTLALAFREHPATTNPEAVAVFPAQPNPTQAGAVLPLRLSVAATVQLDVFDLTGKLLLHQEIKGEPGFQALDLPTGVLALPGVYLWRVNVDHQVFTGRIVRQ